MIWLPLITFEILSCPHATQIFTYKQKYLASDSEQTFLVK